MSEKGITILFTFLFIALLLFPALPAYSNDEEITVSVDQLNVRKGPGLTYDIIGSVKGGERYKVIDRENDWMKISIGKSKDGWVASRYVEEQTRTVSKPAEAVVTVDGLRIRKGPGLNFGVLGFASQDEYVEVLDSVEDWVQISTKNTNGWVAKAYLQFIETSNSETADQSYKKATVTVNRLNVRAGSTITDQIIDTISKGDQVTILEERNQWNKIQYRDNKIGWVAEWYLEKLNVSEPESNAKEAKAAEEIIILYDGTNIRLGPDTTYPVVQRAKQGETFTILKKIGDWYEIEIPSQQRAYVAGWIVSSSRTDSTPEKVDETYYLSGKTIVIDAGHGGLDRGTTGATGTNEKDITIRTGQLLAQKLKSAGANVILTRNDDRYLSLRARVSLSHYYDADAFVSLHYDSFEDPSINGSTSYYYDSANKALAEMIQAELVSKTKFNNRGARYGNYFVLRENNQPAVLLELGYLSNPFEEATIQTSPYQEQVTTGIYYGLAKYFKSISN